MRLLILLALISIGCSSEEPEDVISRLDGQSFRKHAYDGSDGKIFFQLYFINDTEVDFSKVNEDGIPVPGSHHSIGTYSIIEPNGINVKLDYSGQTEVYIGHFMDSALYLEGSNEDIDGVYYR